MNRLQRLLRHLTTTRFNGRRAFPPHTLKAIQAAIADGERCHRAEVRLIIEAALPLGALLENMPSRGRAHELFSRYRIWDTEENCGILIYINLADHKVEIVADRTVGRALNASEWQAACRTMTEGFHRGEFHDSAVAGVRQLNELLAKNFPADGSQANQLSDRPLVL
ncbi:MAG TPA: TPM domain-containing protein [Paucimonas sp.]|nr:TPM domain-containing protein [Paucimonas sp.]